MKKSILFTIICLVIVFICISFIVINSKKANDISNHSVDFVNYAIIYEDYLNDNKSELTNFSNPEKNKLIIKELELCDLFIKDNPDNTYAIERRAILNTYIKNFTNAINDYKLLLEKFPQNTEYVCELADIYRRNKQLQEAKAIMDKYAKIAKNDSNYYREYGKIYWDMGNKNLAIDSYTHAIKINPYYSKYYYERSKLYNQMGEKEKAEKDMETYRSL